MGASLSLTGNHAPAKPWAWRPKHPYITYWAIIVSVRSKRLAPFASHSRPDGTLPYWGGHAFEIWHPSSRRRRRGIRGLRRLRRRGQDHDLLRAAATRR